jgi:hypothetical protein
VKKQRSVQHIEVNAEGLRYHLNKNALQIIRMNFSCRDCCCEMVRSYNTCKLRYVLCISCSSHDKPHVQVGAIW